MSGLQNECVCIIMRECRCINVDRMYEYERRENVYITMQRGSMCTKTERVYESIAVCVGACLR